MEVLEAICSYSDLDFCVAHVKAIHDPFTHISNDRNDTQSDQEDDEDDEGDNVDKNYFVAATQHLHQENEVGNREREKRPFLTKGDLHAYMSVCSSVFSSMMMQHTVSRILRDTTTVGKLSAWNLTLGIRA